MNESLSKLPVALASSAPGAESHWRATFGEMIVRGYLQTALAVGAMVAGLYLCYRLTLPFLTPLAVALVLAILFAPFHRWVEARVRRPKTAAALSVLAIATVVIAPVMLLVVELVDQAATGAILVRAELEAGAVQRLLSSYPTLAPMFQTVLDHLNVQGLASDAAAWLTNVSAALLRGSVMQVVGVLLTFYLLFYFLLDRREALASVRTFLPFTDEETTALFVRVIDTVHATVYGMVVTGVALGIAGGAIFALVGVPAPLLWGLVMGLFAILPVLGTGMIWVPAAILLGFDGAWGRAFILTAAFLILTALDGVLYPYLVGNRMKLHTALAFISAVGGLVVFGVSGFILGPLVVAVTLAIKEIFRSRVQEAESLTPGGTLG